MNAPSAPPIELHDLPLPRGIPVLGNLLQLSATQLHLILEKWGRKHGNFYQLRLASHTALVISDWQAIATILKARPDTFRRFSSIESVFSDMGISGVLSTEGEQWYRQRKLTMRAFDPAHLRDYFPNLVRITERLRQHWLLAAKQQTPVDILADLMCYSLDITAGLAFGTEINTLEGKDTTIQRCLNTIFPAINRRLNTPIPYWRYFKLPADHALDKNLQILQDTVNTFIAQTRVRMNANPVLFNQPTNLIEALIAVCDQPDSGFTDEDVYGNVFTILLVGADSTANVTAWLGYFLCGNERIQASIQAEADKTLGEHMVLQDFNLASSLRYIEATAMETMRLKPSGPVIFLEANCDTSIQHVHISKGTPIFALMRPGGMEPDHFPEPDNFDPERWLDTGNQTEAALSPKRIVMPFGAGPRLCPGRYLALLQIKMLASMLGHNFTITEVSDKAVEERFKFTMEPVNLKVRLKERHLVV